LNGTFYLVKIEGGVQTKHNDEGVFLKKGAASHGREKVKSQEVRSRPRSGEAGIHLELYSSV